MIANPIQEPVVRRGLTTMEKVAGTLLSAGLFLGFELLGGSSWAFSALVALYIVLMVVTIEVAGGVATLFGIFVLFYSFQHVVAAQLMKFALGERSDARLSVPVITMLAENLALLGICAGLSLVRAIRPHPRRFLFPPIRDLVTLQRVALIGTGLTFARQAVMLLTGAVTSDTSGTALGPIAHLGLIDLVTFAAAVGVAVIESGGRRMTNRLVWLLLIPQILVGSLAGARLSIALPVVAMFGGALAFGFRLRPRHFAISVALAYIFFYIISPFGLMIRGTIRGTRHYTIAENVQIVLSMLGDVIENPGQHQKVTAAQLAAVPKAWYATLYFMRRPDGTSNLMERFAMMKLDDLFIDATLRQGYVGWTTISPGFSRMLPSVLGFPVSNRPSGNMLAHRVEGIVQVNDNTTAISTGVVGDAFSAFGWAGVLFGTLVMTAVIALVYGFIIDSRLNYNVFGIALAVVMTWPFSESTLGTATATPTNDALIAIAAFFIVTRAAKLADFRYLRPRVPLEEAGPSPSEAL